MDLFGDAKTKSYYVWYGFDYKGEHVNGPFTQEEAQEEVKRLREDNEHLDFVTILQEV